MSLERSFSVWSRGFGLGIPIVTLFTFVMAYNKLVDRGITSWDRRLLTNVEHEPVGFIRGLIAIIVIVAIAFLVLFE